MLRISHETTVMALILHGGFPVSRNPVGHLVSSADISRTVGIQRQLVIPRSVRTNKDFMKG